MEAIPTTFEAIPRTNWTGSLNVVDVAVAVGVEMLATAVWIVGEVVGIEVASVAAATGVAKPGETVAIVCSVCVMARAETTALVDVTASTGSVGAWLVLAALVAGAVDVVADGAVGDADAVVTDGEPDASVSEAVPMAFDVVPADGVV